MSIFSLDRQTACLMAGLICMMSGVAAHSVRRLHGPSREAIATWASALVVGGTAMLLAAMHSAALNDDWTQRIAAIGIAAAAVLSLEGVRQLYEHPPRLSLAMITIGFVAAILVASPSPLFTAQIQLAVQTVCAIMAATCAMLAQDKAAWLQRTALGASFVVMAMTALGQLLIIVAHPDTLQGEAGSRVIGADGWAMAMQALVPLTQAWLLQAIAAHRQLALLAQQASTDELTGAASRRFLFARAEHWLNERIGNYPNTALLMIDIDDFKSVNERYGHHVGDRVLRHVAAILQRSLRRDALMARYSGEEFCALVPVGGEGEARLLADRLRRAVESENYVDGDLTIASTVSIGLALHRAGLTLSDVLRAADRRVYEAKTQGRNRVVTDEPVLETAVV